MKSSRLRPWLRVVAGGESLTSSAGAVLLVQTARATGLDRLLCKRLARWRLPLAIHDPGKVVLALAFAVALGGDCAADIAVVRAQPGLFGLVTSDPTVFKQDLIAALRCIYRHAKNDGHIQPGNNPALKVAKPRRLPSTRHAVPDTRLAEINQIAATTGNDPALDTLILRLHTETACRRGGALALTPADMDSEQCLIRLREKGETVRWQPVSPTSMAHLQQHADQRGAPPNGQLLRYTNGRPITSRRYDHLWVRIGRHVPWVATQQISTHWLRHTTLTWVERNFGYAIARAYAGHTDSGNAGTTATYVRASLAEIAAAQTDTESPPC